MRLSLLLPAVVLALAPFAGCFGGSNEKAGAPTCDFKVTPQADGMTFLFDATNSTPADATIAWSFGDEGVAAGPLSGKEGLGLIEYVYAVTNTIFHVSMVVRNAEGDACFDMKNVPIGSGNNTMPQIVLKNTTRWVNVSGAVVLDASKSFDADQDFFSYEWTLGTYADSEMAIASDYLKRGQSFNHTFETEGVYDFHCHPHPWMKSRVIVSSGDSNATDGATVKIANFTYDLKTTTVTPGSTVQWINDDPVEHTATLEQYGPGKVVHTGPVFSTRLETAGDYQVRLTLNDGKGGIVHNTWGLRASADAPPSPWLQTLFSDPVNHVEGAPAGNTAYGPFEYKSEWPANLTATVTWADPSMNNAGTARIQLLKGTTVLTECTADGQSCTLQYNLVADTYSIKLFLAGYHFNNDVEVTTSALQYAFPPFGDPPCPPDKHRDPGNGECVKHGA